MEIFVVMGNALEDLQRILHIGLCHRHRLETALQGGILLNKLAVLIKGGSADDLYLTPGQGGLEDVGGIHAALSISGAHDVMHLVNDQDDVPGLADFLDESLHTALELATELGPGHQGRQVQQVDLLIPQLKGHLPGYNTLGQALGNSGLTYTGLTDKAGIILLAAVQNLHHTLDFLLPANNRIQLSLPSPAGKVDAVIIQKLALFLGLAALGLPALGRLVPGLLFRRGLAAAEKAVQKREGSGLSALILVAALLLGQILQLLGAAEGLHHLAAEALQVLRGDAHALHHVLHLGQAQLGGALQAESLVDHLVFLVHPGDEHHSHIFLTL